MEREPHDVLGVSTSAPWPEVRAAFRTLARRYHPDGTTPDPREMMAVNAAYEALELRRAWPSGGQSAAVPVGPGTGATTRDSMPAGPPVGSLLWRVQAARQDDTPKLDFGQYTGWTIAEVARQDPRYLLWLSRHSSGIRFRRVIEQVLGSSHDIGRRAALIT